MGMQAEAAHQEEATTEFLNRFRIIDFGLADFSEHYAAGFVEMAGPSPAGQLLRPLASVPMALEHIKAIPKVTAYHACHKDYNILLPTNCVLTEN